MKNALLFAKLKLKLALRRSAEENASNSLLPAVWLMAFHGALGAGLGGLFGYPLRASPPLALQTEWYLQTAGVFLLVAMFVILSKLFSPSRFSGHTEFRTIAHLPLKRSSVIVLDIVLGLMDNLYVLFLCAYIAFCVASGTGGSAVLAALYPVLALFVLLSLHAVSELLESIIRYLGGRSRMYSMLFMVGAVFGVAAVVRMPDIHVAAYTPIGWAFRAIHAYRANAASPDFHFPFAVNTAAIAVAFTIADIFHRLSYGAPQRSVGARARWMRPKRLSEWNYFSWVPRRLMPMFEKDVRYIFRCARTYTAMGFELIACAVILYMYYGSAAQTRRYMAMMLIVVFPLVRWDFYLSNQWGFDRSAFCVFLYMPTDDRMLLLSKNMSFLFARLPFAILEAAAFGFFFGYALMPYLILLYGIFTLMGLILGNLTSISTPYPVNMSDSGFSTVSSPGFSSFGLIWILSVMIVPGGLLGVLWYWGMGTISAVAFGGVFAVTAYVYARSIALTTRRFGMNKQRIRIKLITS